MSPPSRAPLAAAATVVLLVVALLDRPGAAADDGGYAPLDRPGPALEVSPADVQAALDCGGSSLREPTRNPILLVHGTNLDAESNFGWNYARDFAARGWPFCTLDLPVFGLDDVQVAGEYVVFAIRTMSEASGRKVDVVGYSQGGMVPRWALRFWPDTRRLVGDLVGLAPSNHGTVLSQVSCRSSCPPAHWQQAASATFIEALNSRAETFAGIDYTVIYTRYDEIVVPNLDGRGSTLRTGDGAVTNVSLQEVCPSNAADHLAIGTYDAVGHALVLDALVHEGPADPGRVPLTVCAEPFQPGVDPATFAADYARVAEVIGESSATGPQAPGEPPPKCYVTVSCAPDTGATEPLDGSAAGGSPVVRTGEPELPATGGSSSMGSGAMLAAVAVFGVGLANAAVGARRRRCQGTGSR